MTIKPRILKKAQKVLGIKPVKPSIKTHHYLRLYFDLEDLSKYQDMEIPTRAPNAILGLAVLETKCKAYQYYDKIINTMSNLILEGKPQNFTKLRIL